MRAHVALLLLSWAAAGAACKEDAPSGKPQEDAGAQNDAGSKMPALSREELLNPETCKSCHPKHYREWASSMHAYAAKDPVFLAMNQRGQRETKGKLGDFCVNCHAPMAVREGKTKDGLNLDRVMWATDFPHSDGTYPHSRAIMADVTAGMTAAERDKILYHNAATLYGIGT